MKNFIYYVISLALLLLLPIASKGENMEETQDNNKFNKLTAQERQVIDDKGTEPPFRGQYYAHYDTGTYTCKKCDLPLYRSTAKFKSSCGWPSFDAEIPGAVRRQPDKDGVRTEIACAYCGAHLGHVFTGEDFTPKNVRHCVNSISMNFIPAGKPLKRNRAVFAAGCFWGVEALLKDIKGVIDTRAGYTGGAKDNPTYEEVCANSTGHAETVEVIYDPRMVSYETLLKVFFEIHDFTQVDRQGPDIGEQYRSVIFYTSKSQKELGEKYIVILKDKGYEVATKLMDAGQFWPAEEYHQDYYEKNNKRPYCHFRRDIFDE